MRLTPLLSIGFLMGVGLFTGSAASWERNYHFESDKLNGPPEGFILEDNADSHPIFLVQKKPKDKNKFLALCGATFGGSKPLVALAWYSNLKNGEVSVDFMHSGNPETIRKAGLVWRYQGLGETYYVECDTVKSVVRFVVFSKGKKKVLEDAKVEFPPTVWIQLAVVFQDDGMKCLVGGKPVFESKDGKISGKGRVGIYLDSDITVLFDNFKIKESE